MHIYAQTILTECNCENRWLRRAAQAHARKPCIIQNFFVLLRSKPKTNTMTRFEHFLTLIVSPICFVIQWVTVDRVISNHLISGDDVLSNHPIAGRGVYLTNTPSGDNLISSKVIPADDMISTYIILRGCIKIPMPPLFLSSCKGFIG